MSVASARPARQAVDVLIYLHRDFPDLSSDGADGVL